MALFCFALACLALLRAGCSSPPSGEAQWSAKDTGACPGAGTDTCKWGARVGQARADFTESYMKAVGNLPLLQQTLREAGFPVGRALGHLTVAGGGVRVTQVTVETLQALDAADLVLYSVADAVTESFVRARRPDAIDLFTLYDDGKLGDETDVQVAEAIVAPVRLGLRVAALLFGHPGVFDLRGHRAIAIAKKEGFEARMLAAVSVADNLYADLGVDPSSPGMQIIDATDILLRRRVLDPASSATIYGIGCVGDPTFRHTGSTNSHFTAFIRQLILSYGEMHEVAIYVASMRPLDKPSVRLHTLGELERMSAVEVLKRVAGIATMYVPPASEADVDEDLATKENLVTYVHYEGGPVPFGYGPQEVEAIQNLTTFTMPSFYEYLEDRDAQVIKLLLDVAMEPTLRDQFERNPEDVLQNYSVTPDRVGAYVGRVGGVFFGTAVKSIANNRNKFQLNKIMHHHNVVSSYFQNVSESAMGWNPPLPIVSPSSSRASPRRPELAGVATRSAATESFMQAVGSPGKLEEVLRAVGLTWDRAGKGELVVVGTGLRVNQVTLETLQAIDEADLVLYSVADSLTERFIRTRRPDAIDLYTLYGNGKQRDETYTQTAEAMLAPARLGLRVVTAFYGHPGVFDFPSHRAIAIARAEGLRARMLPAPSASDNLYADLGVDPVSPGVQTREATDVLLQARGLDTTSHALIYQIGGVGDPGFNYTGSKNPKFGKFAMGLVDTYGASHEVVLYMATRLPMAGPDVSVRSLGELAAMSESELAHVVTGITTMFVPALSQTPLDVEALHAKGLGVYLGEPINAFGYGARELLAVQHLERFSMPASHPSALPERAMDGLMLDLAMDPKFQHEFTVDQDGAMKRYNVTGPQLVQYIQDVPGAHMFKSYRGTFLMRPHVMSASM